MHMQDWGFYGGSMAPGWLWLLLLWELAWKGVGLWWAARNQQIYWYIAILLINSAGLLPILYLLFFRKDKKVLRTS